jgi:hypothetical protein
MRNSVLLHHKMMAKRPFLLESGMTMAAIATPLKV